MVSLSVIVSCALFGLAVATTVEQCPGKSFQDLSSNVNLSCKKTPCRLKKGTNTYVTVVFTPDTDIKELKNHVIADVLGVPLPFIGVDGKSICDKIETESGEKASCPLKAGTKYIYKDSFPVEHFYPSINVKVHWALQSGGKDVTCFEIPARIS